MKIVIDIPDAIYERFGYEYSELNLISVDVDNAIIDAFINGTLLPNGHGRLIDADAFQKYCFNKNFDERLSDGGLATINLFLGFQPTIIEADTGETGKYLKKWKETLDEILGEKNETDI